MRYLDTPSASVRAVTLIVSALLLAATVALLHRRFGSRPPASVNRV